MVRATPPGEISQLLGAWSAGEKQALEELMPRVYKELRLLAARQLRGERADHTLQTTGLVNEAFLKLVEQEGVQWNDRAHFFAIAATVMRRVLVDYARQRHAEKRGGGAEKVALDKVELAASPDADLIDLDRCLCRLEELDPRQARVVELRYFAGCTIEEISDGLDISPSTVKREWRLAKVWLRAELQEEGIVGD